MEGQSTGTAATRGSCVGGAAGVVGVRVVAASVPGTQHTLPGKPLWKNNQDAFHVVERPGVVVGVVADGCSKGAHSEVGATVGARVTACLVAEVAGRTDRATGATGPMGDAEWTEIRDALLSKMRVMHLILGDDEDVVRDCLLFALIGFVVTPEWTTIFRIGDGMDAVNGEVRVTPRFEVAGRPDLENAPPYVMYAVTGSPVTDASPELLRFDVRVFKTSDVRTLLVASDGGEDLLRAEAELFPGTTTEVGPLSQVFDDAFFDNPDNLRRFLSRMNRETVVDGRVHAGLLPDDTTIIAVRVAAQREDGETT